MTDAQGNSYGPYDTEVANSAAEPLTEATWYDLDRTSGVVEGLNLTFNGRTAQLSPGMVRVHGSFLRRYTQWTDISPATTTSAPRRDLLVARRQLTSGSGPGAVPGRTFFTVLRGNPAATPTDPTFDASNDEPLWSWQVPGNGGNTITDVHNVMRAVRRGGAGPHGVELYADQSTPIPPNTLSPTAFGDINVIGGDPDHYLQPGIQNQVHIPYGLGGVYALAWGGGLTTVPPGRHFWDLIIEGSQNERFRANGYGDDNVSGATVARLAGGDNVRFQVFVAGVGPNDGNWSIASRHLSVFLLGS